MADTFIEKSRHKHFLAGFFANAIWGFMALPLRSIMEWSPLTILYGRVMVAFLFLWSLLMFFRKGHIKEDIKHFYAQDRKQRNRFIGLIVLSSFLIVGNWLSFIYVVNRVSVSSAALAYLVCPLLTTLAAFFILHERLSKMKWLTMILALFCVFILAQASPMEVVWAIVVAMFYAFYLIIQRMLSQIDKLNLLALQLLVGVLLLMPIFWIDTTTFPESFDFWYIIAIIAIFFTVLPLFLSLFALNRINSSTLGILIYINPIISFIIAVFYFHEPLQWSQLAAYGLLIIAVFLFNFEIVKQIFGKFVGREFDNR